MGFRLVDSGWHDVFDDALKDDHSAVRVICPFIKRRAAERLLRHGRPADFQVITRFNLRDFASGVSDIDALRFLIENGARIRGVQNLHAKLYIFGNSRVVLTSANLTEAALLRNHEFGCVDENRGVVAQCRLYFDALWRRAGNDVDVSRLAGWANEIKKLLVAGMPPASTTGLRDEGVDAGLHAVPAGASGWPGEAGQAFVKFFGSARNRADRALTVIDEVGRSGSHWACTYPYGKRPRKVNDGAIMFMARLVKDPNDIVIYGRAIGVQHQPGRDDATPEEIALRKWKAEYPYYVRVHHAEFVAGTLSNGVSLNEMMNMLDADSFASSQQNAMTGTGSTNPRKAYMRQAAVELSPQGLQWMREKLDQAFSIHGILPSATLQPLDWPVVPAATSI